MGTEEVCAEVNMPILFPNMTVESAVQTYGGRLAMVIAVLIVVGLQ